METFSLLQGFVFFLAKWLNLRKREMVKPCLLRTVVQCFGICKHVNWLLQLNYLDSISLFLGYLEAETPPHHPWLLLVWISTKSSRGGGLSSKWFIVVTKREGDQRLPIEMNELEMNWKTVALCQFPMMIDSLIILPVGELVQAMSLWDIKLFTNSVFRKKKGGKVQTCGEGAVHMVRCT